MQKIIFILLSATLLLAATVETQNKKPFIKKQVKITANIEAKIAKKELERAEKTKLREDKIKKVDMELKEKAIKRTEA